MRARIFLLSMAGLLAVCLRVQAQSDPVYAALDASIGQVRAGDFYGALFTLNDVVRQLSARREEGTALARAHAYLALVHTRLQQPERAQAAVLKALAADPSIRPAPGEFTPEVIALFDRARTPSTQNPEEAGKAAEQAGRFQEAFLDYTRAFRGLPDPPAAADDQRLRESITRVVQKLDTKPLVPPEAQQHLDKAQGLLDAQAILGGQTDSGALQAAAAELRKAVRVAPWWPDAAFKLAAVLQKLGRFDEALANLDLYRRADPQGYAAAAERANPKATAQSRPEPARKVADAPAVVYVYWPPQIRGGGKPGIVCDGQRVAKLGNGRFIVLNVGAGAHIVRFHDRDLSAVFESGHEYYVRVSAEGFPAHAALRITTKDEATAEMQAKGMAPNDPKNTFSDGCGAGAAGATGQKPRRWPSDK